MFLGLRSAIYHVADLAAAKAWYTNVLGQAPYFDEAFYAGFNVGGFELGLDPDYEWVVPGNQPIAYWGVSDAKATYAQLVTKGAKEHAPIKDVGEGILIGSVVDPFGNLLGIIENPLFGKNQE